MSENSCSLDFYNMLVHIVFKNRVSEENVAVKNAWEKNGTLFFDLYFYRAKKGKLLDAALVRDLYDLNTEKYYYSAQNFYQDFLQSRRLAAEQAEEIKKPSPVYRHKNPSHSRICYPCPSSVSGFERAVCQLVSQKPESR